MQIYIYLYYLPNKIAFICIFFFFYILLHTNSYINQYTFIYTMRIKEILKQKGMTQKDLADRMGVAEISLSRSINGNPNLSTLEKIADALNVKIEELFAPKGETTHFLCPKCGAELQLIERKKEE